MQDKKEFNSTNGSKGKTQELIHKKKKFRVCPCGKVALGQVFLPSTSVLPCQFHFTGAPLLGKMKKLTIFLVIFIRRVAECLKAAMRP
jgi:hypothetical protein